MRRKKEKERLLTPQEYLAAVEARIASRLAGRVEGLPLSQKDAQTYLELARGLLKRTYET